jgi:ubiquinone/menaquinone biosynthesis C-methylase UbiE
MKKIYLKDKGILAFFDKKADAAFWDKHWDGAKTREMILQQAGGGIFSADVKKYVPAHGKVLEAGCGFGGIVYNLMRNNFQATGIDFAAETIKTTKRLIPELDVIEGDIRKMNFPDNYFDGYISGGVIEHFWEGYDSILAEMKRVLKPGGYVFMTFPYMSPLRRLKAKLNFYEIGEVEKMTNSKEFFYQFALDQKKVLSDLVKMGFVEVSIKRYDGIKGFKDEVTFLKPILQKLYDNSGHEKLKRYLDFLLLPFAAHCSYIIMKKT